MSYLAVFDLADNPQPVACLSSRESRTLKRRPRHGSVVRCGITVPVVFSSKYRMPRGCL
jgi:hypothetical protein